VTITVNNYFFQGSEPSLFSFNLEHTGWNPPSPNNNPGPFSEKKHTSRSEVEVREKTILCTLWLTGGCYREFCGFSHDPKKIIPTPVSHAFKTKYCQHEGEKACPYGLNCKFLHKDDYIKRKKNLIYVSLPDPIFEGCLIVYRIGCITSTKSKKDI